MSILDSKSKKMLVESMRGCVKSILNESVVLTAKQATDKSKFVSEKATYEQLLNITMNPLRKSKYLPDYVLEGAVAILHRACLTGRKHIGVNAITEGALKLHKETGAVITESMLDAALNSVQDGCGLKVVGSILKEAKNVLLKEDGFSALANALSKSGVPGLGGGGFLDRISNIGKLGGTGFKVTNVNALTSAGIPISMSNAIARAINSGNADEAMQAARMLTSYNVRTGKVLGIASDRIKQNAIDKLKVPINKKIPSPMTNPNLIDLERKLASKGGGGWGKTALVGAGALAAGLGGAYLWNKKKQAQMQQQ